MRKRLDTGLPPGPQGLPLVGSLLQFQHDPLNFIPGVPRPRVTLRPKYGIQMTLEPAVPLPVGLSA